MGGNQIETTFKPTYKHRHRDTHAHAHTQTNTQTFEDSPLGLFLGNLCNWCVADIYYRYYSKAKDIIQCSLSWKLLLESGNCTNSCKNREIKINVEAKEVEVWDQERFSFSKVHSCELSYVFLDEMNLPC